MKTLKTTAFALFAAMGLTMMSASAPASEKGRRNTTYALGAATVYHLLKGHTKEALLFSAGTYLANQKWQDAKDRNKRDRWDRYRGSYQSGDRYQGNYQTRERYRGSYQSGDRYRGSYQSGYKNKTKRSSRNHLARADQCR